MAVLYRKYRPQSFGEVVGQKYTIQTLKNQVEGLSVSHAYLFTGSRGVGKTSVARILAKAVNCEKKDSMKGEACAECSICKAIEQGAFLDLVEIDAASNTGVDNVRELIEHVKFSPSVGKYKVFIIDEVHMLSKGAFNALLKTLEEPPKHAIFILATTEINKVPATIVSRTQRFDFKRLSAQDLEKHLEDILKREKIKLDKKILALISEQAEGSVRDALSLLEKVLSLGEDATLEESEQLLGITDLSISVKLLELILQKSAAQLPEFFDSLSEQGLDFTIFNKDFLEFLRKVLIYKVSNGQIDGLLPQDHEQKIKDLSGLLSTPDLMFIIRLFLRSYKELPFSPSAQIPLLLASLEAEAKMLSGGQALPQTQIPKGHPPAIVETQPAKAVLPPKVDISEAVHSPKNEDTAKSTANPADEIAANIALEEIQPLWPKVIQNIKAINGPLASLVKKSVLLGTENGRVILGVKFLFDKQNLENAKNQTTIKKVFEEVLGKKVGVSAVVLKEEKAKNTTAEAVTDALKIFGGELIE